VITNSRSLVGLCLAFIALPLPTLAVEIEHDRYANANLGLRFDAPFGWSVTQQTGYPPLLAVLTSTEHPSCKISVAYDANQLKQPLSTRVRGDNHVLRAMGLRVISSGAVTHLGRQAWRTRADWQAKGKDLQLAQLYLPLPSGTALVISASGPGLSRINQDVNMLIESIEGLNR
jgi:hypothetical protein